MKRPLLLSAVIALSLLLSGCGGADAAEEVIRSGKIRVFVAEDNGIYSYPSENGQEGLEIDIARAVGADLNVELELIPIPKGELLTAFDNGGADIAIGRLALTDSLRYNYSTSISYASGRLFALTASGIYFPSISSLENKAIGVSDRLSEPAGIAVSGISGVKKQVYADTSSVPGNLITGAISAYICYEEQAFEYMGNPELQAGNIYGADSEQYVVIGRKGADTLMKRVNITITRMLESGETEELLAGYRAQTGGR